MTKIYTSPEVAKLLRANLAHVRAAHRAMGQRTFVGQAAVFTEEDLPKLVEAMRAMGYRCTVPEAWVKVG